MVDKVRLAVTRPGVPGRLQHQAVPAGLTFKAGTDDLRDSPALGVAALLRQAGAELYAHDPGIDADPVGWRPGGPGGISVVDDPYIAAKDCDAVVVLTEWTQFRLLTGKPGRGGPPARSSSTRATCSTRHPWAGAGSAGSASAPADRSSRPHSAEIPLGASKMNKSRLCGSS